MRCVRRTADGVAAHNAFHLILQLELDLLQPRFFDLFGFREVGASREVVNPFVEIVVSGGELSVGFVALQQLALQLFEVFRHFRLLGRGYSW
jgi:hypothetical protein